MWDVCEAANLSPLILAQDELSGTAPLVNQQHAMTKESNTPSPTENCLYSELDKVMLRRN